MAEDFSDIFGGGPTKVKEAPQAAGSGFDDVFGSGAATPPAAVKPLNVGKRKREMTPGKIVIDPRTGIAAEKKKSDTPKSDENSPRPTMARPGHDRESVVLPRQVVTEPHKAEKDRGQRDVLPGTPDSAMQFSEEVGDMARQIVELQSKLDATLKRIELEEEWKRTEGETQAGQVHAAQADLEKEKRAHALTAAERDAKEKQVQGYAEDVAREREDHEKALADAHKTVRELLGKVEDLTTKVTEMSIAAQTSETTSHQQAEQIQVLTRQLESTRASLERYTAMAHAQGQSLSDKVRYTAQIEFELGQAKKAAQELQRLTGANDDLRTAEQKAAARVIELEGKLATAERQLANALRGKEVAENMRTAVGGLSANIDEMLVKMATMGQLSQPMMKKMLEVIAAQFKQVAVGQNLNDPTLVTAAGERLAGIDEALSGKLPFGMKKRGDRKVPEVDKDAGGDVQTPKPQEKNVIVTGTEGGDVANKDVDRSMPAGGERVMGVIKTEEAGGVEAGVGEVKSPPVAGKEIPAANVTPPRTGETGSPKPRGLLARFADRAGSVVPMARRREKGANRDVVEQQVLPAGAPAPDVVAGVTAPDNDRVVVGGTGSKEGEEQK